MPQTWPVRFVDENIRKATAAEIAWADVVVVSGMHVQASQDPRHRGASARRRQGRDPGRTVCIGLPEIYPDIDYLHIGEMGDHHRLIARLDESVRARAPPMRFENRSDRPPLQDFPHPGLRSRPAQKLPDADAAVLQRLSLSVRVLRHSQPLRPAAAAQDAGGRSPPSSMPCASRKGIRRWSISSMTISSATAKPPRTCCRTCWTGRSSAAIP